MSREKQINLFKDEELKMNINGVRAVNTVDIHDLIIPFDGVEGQFLHLQEFVDKGEYLIHSSGAYHWFHQTRVTLFRPGKLPNYFTEPVFPWIQSIHNKSGNIRVPGVPQTKAPYPYIALGKKSKKLYIHILAASAFLTRPDDPKYCIVSHQNDMKWDYSLRNLFWNTHKNNSVGFKKERRMNPIEVFDKWWEEFERGIDYNVEEWQKEEDQF